MEEVLRVRINKKTDETVGKISLSSNDDSVGEVVEFESLKKYATGSTVSIVDGKEQFRGLVVEMSDRTNPPFSYRIVDYSWNLDSEEFVQFTKIRADEALKKLFTKYNIKYSICSIPTKISKIYYDKTLKDIIKDILSIAGKEQGKKYYYEVVCGKVIVEERKKLVVDAKFIVQDDTEVKRSVTDLRNSVVIVDSTDKKGKILASVKNKEYITKFGLKQIVETLDGTDKKQQKAKAKSKAENLLKQNCKQKNTCSVALFVISGFWNIRKGRKIKLKLGRLNGWYTIRSVQKTIENGHYWATVELEW